MTLTRHRRGRARFADTCAKSLEPVRASAWHLSIVWCRVVVCAHLLPPARPGRRSPAASAAPAWQSSPRRPPRCRPWPRTRAVRRSARRDAVCGSNTQKLQIAKRNSTHLQLERRLGAQHVQRIGGHAVLAAALRVAHFVAAQWRCGWRLGGWRRRRRFGPAALQEAEHLERSVAAGWRSGAGNGRSQGRRRNCVARQWWDVDCVWLVACCRC